VTYVNFNYDTLADEALRDVTGYDLFNTNGYISGETWLLKPHGSWNWVTQVIPGYAMWDWDQTGSHPPTVRSLLTRDAGQWARSRKFRVVEHVDDVFRDGVPHYPALAIPVEEKARLFMPDGHEAALAETIATAEQVISIGWRATEYDFLEKMAALPEHTPFHTVVPTEHEGQEIAARISGKGVAAAFSVHPMKFSDFVRSPNLADILKG
jgi:hypothetical protein